MNPSKISPHGPSTCFFEKIGLEVIPPVQAAVQMYASPLVGQRRRQRGEAR